MMSRDDLYERLVLLEESHNKVTILPMIVSTE